MKRRQTCMNFLFSISSPFFVYVCMLHFFFGFFFLNSEDIFLLAYYSHISMGKSNHTILTREGKHVKT